MSDDSIHDSIARRSFLKGAGAAGTAVATALSGALPVPAEAQTTPPAKEVSAARAAEPLLTLTATEAAFLGAAYDTFIPADRLSPSGTDCGLLAFIDGQLAGAWGGGAKLYRSGPFIAGTREQGYQLSLTPREFFAAGIKAANAWTRKTYGKDFDRLSGAEREAALKTMDAGKAEFDEINAKQFFEMLLASAMDGFFADPIYGGNRDKVSWRMVGYPGLPATYASKALEYRGKKIVLEPQSIADFS
jgi:gluconate 2-dehydrogenase gamma chain